MSEQKLTVENMIMNSALSENWQKTGIEFCRFLKDNDFSIEPEDHTEDDVSGWKIFYMAECVGHMNFSKFAKMAIWIDTCDFGGSGSADDALKKTTWAHVRICEHFSSGGKKCGCGNQPGSTKIMFGKKFENLCFALLEFMNPDAKTVDDIKKLLLLFTQSKSDTQRS